MPMSLPDQNKQQTYLRSAQSFSRDKRLLDAAQFRKVFQANDKVGDRYWTILYRENSGLVARLGMAMAKKKVKRAVDRSRLKRLVRESFRQHDLPCVDIVVMPRDSTAEASSLILKNSLNKQWARIVKRCAV